MNCTGFKDCNGIEIRYGDVCEYSDVEGGYAKAVIVNSDNKATAYHYHFTKDGGFKCFAPLENWNTQVYFKILGNCMDDEDLTVGIVEEGASLILG